MKICVIISNKYEYLYCIVRYISLRHEKYKPFQFRKITALSLTKLTIDKKYKITNVLWFNVFSGTKDAMFCYVDDHTTTTTTATSYYNNNNNSKLIKSYFGTKIIYM